jgi:hypothetical protein
VNCRCTWRIERDDDEIRAYWVLSGAEHCATCQDRAALYAPLVIAVPKDAETTAAE